MSALRITAHFQSLRDDIVIPGTDLGSFKYYSKETDTYADLHEIYKRSLLESQGKTWKLSNRRPLKLREQLEEFENILAGYSPVYSSWQTSVYLVHVFSTGVIVHMNFCTQSGDLVQITIDRTMEGKLVAEVTSVAITKDVIYLTYGIPQLTIIQADRPICSSEQPALLSQCSLSVQDVVLPGPTTRRHERKLFLNKDRTMLCVWWTREGSDLYAWSPVVRAEDRANVLLYSLKPNTFMDLVACKRTETDPAGLEISTRDPSLLRLTEILSTAKGRVNIVSTLFNIHENMRQVQQRVLRVGCPPRCFSYSPDDQLLFLGCVDASIITWNLARDTTVSARASFIPFFASWHSSSALLVISSNRGHLQCWDRALNSFQLQLPNSPTSREQGSRAVVHLGQYFRVQPTPIALKWADNSATDESPVASREDTNKGKIERSSRRSSYRSTRRKLKLKRTPRQIHTSARAAPAQYLFVLFERGPLVCLRFSTGCYPGCTSLSALSLCSEYLLWDLKEQAVQFMLSLNWTDVASFQEEDQLLSCFSKVTNHLLRDTEFCSKNEKMLESVLIQIADIVRNDEALEAPVHDTLRRCVRYFIRSSKLHSAAKLALQLQDPDLFVELIVNAKAAGDQALTQHVTAALEYVKSLRLDSFTSSCSSSCDTCSDSCSSSSSSCSSCTDEVQSVERQPGNASSRALSGQLSDLRLAEDPEDQVRVVSFGVV